MSLWLTASVTLGVTSVLASCWCVSPVKRRGCCSWATASTFGCWVSLVDDALDALRRRKPPVAAAASTSSPTTTVRCLRGVRLWTRRRSNIDCDGVGDDGDDADPDDLSAAFQTVCGAGTSDWRTADASCFCCRKTPMPSSFALPPSLLFPVTRAIKLPRNKSRRFRKRLALSVRDSAAPPSTFDDGANELMWLTDCERGIGRLPSPSEMGSQRIVRLRDGAARSKGPWSSPMAR